LRKILSCIARMRGEGDFTLVADILRGEAPKPWQALTTFGILKPLSRATLLAFCESLELEGCLTGMTITRKGYDLIKERLIPDRFLLLQAATESIQTKKRPRPERGLAAALRQWVKEEAERRALPHFRVLTAAMIADIARKKPTTPEELLLIPGIGERRLAKYGDAIIELIRVYE
jgi:superfamily II DNA helicase RecQ